MYVHCGHNNKNTCNYYWSHDKQESSRNSSIGHPLIELPIFNSAYENFTDLCVDFCYIFDSIHDYSDYKVNGLRCSLKLSIMNKIRLFISWMATKMTDDNFELYAELLISLTREQFNILRQEDMKRLYNMSRPSCIEPHTHMPTFTRHTK